MAAGVQIEAGSVAQALLKTYEYFYDQGWTDGLPVVPPTKEMVEQFVQASGRKANDSIAILPPRSGRATVEVVAINAVMAGCRPEYMPVVIAALDGIADPAFRLNVMQVTTAPSTPFLLINGPVRKLLNINYGTGCLGPGWRANATIGRAIRLIMQNVGGAIPGVYSMASFGSPLRYTYVCGENEEENPWTPFHVDKGFGRTDSAVTVFRATNYVNISGGMGVGPDDILRQIATQMPPMDGGGRDAALVLLGVNHAQALHNAGLTKREVQERLWECAALPVDYFARDFVEMEQRAGKAGLEVIHRTARPDDIYVAVAGGPGPQDVYIAVGGYQTRQIMTG